MNGICMTDAVKLFGVTSKMLRYCERVGLLESRRAETEIAIILIITKKFRITIFFSCSSVYYK